MEQEKRLDFFIIGAQKGGTTALYKKLTTHPQIASCGKKEIHFFDRETVDWDNPDFTNLHKHFAEASPDKVRGEATPVYLFWPNALDRLKAYNPKAKIIISLRHPAYRAFSHWKMEAARGREKLSFHQATSKWGKSRKARAERYYWRNFSYVERGLYGRQLAEVYKRFPKKRVFVTTTEMQANDEATMLRDLFTFLKVDPEFQPQTEKVIRPNTNEHIQHDATQEIARLTERYADEIRKAGKLSGLDLDHWLKPDYKEASLG